MNQKEGLDYFPMECVTDESIRLVTAEYGLQALSIIVKVYQMIYGGHGYYCEWNAEVGLLFAQENGLGCKQVSALNEILLCCMRRGVFSRLQYEKNGILTSEKIQEIFLMATKRRKNVKMKKAYLLVEVALFSENVDILDDNVDILNGNVITLEQSRVEESKLLISSSIPTLDEVKEYVKSNSIKLDCNKFYSYYQMRGWQMSNGSYVSDWKAAIDYWFTNERKPPTSKASRGTSKKNQFNDFESRNVSKNDMDSLEKMLLSK